MDVSAVKPVRVVPVIPPETLSVLLI